MSDTKDRAEKETYCPVELIDFCEPPLRYFHNQSVEQVRKIAEERSQQKPAVPDCPL